MTSFLILADTAASQRVAGLALLDRLVLALDEYAEQLSPPQIIDAVIFWNPETPATARWLPRHPRITRVRLTESLKSTSDGARVLHARLFVSRNGMTAFLKNVPAVHVANPPEQTSTSWNALTARFINDLGPVPARSGASRPWRFINTDEHVRQSEGDLLREAGKSQDGIISRLLNRPLSRRLSRFLLTYDLAPSTWTMYSFALPIFAFICLARGDYLGIVAGAALFQVYSIVDGCDGEIARATYQESERGGRIDDFLDMLGSILFVLGLGLGLFRSRSSIYLLESIISATVIVVNEWSLRRVNSADEPGSDKLTASLYPRHRRLLANGILARRNERFLWWIVQFTKRDVAIFIFLILALLDQAQWILHLWLAVSAATLLLSTRSSVGQGNNTSGPGL